MTYNVLLNRHCHLANGVAVKGLSYDVYKPNVQTKRLQMLDQLMGQLSDMTFHLSQSERKMITVGRLVSGFISYILAYLCQSQSRKLQLLEWLTVHLSGRLVHLLWSGNDQT